MWSSITSQPLVVSLLKSAISSGRTHHAYIFTGDDSETEPVALAFAQSLNCEKNDGDFCGKCESCLAIAKGSHPDVHALKAESKSRRIVISQVRELEKSIYLKSSRARMKVAMIHSADRLQPEAQDAILKTLEEPPPKTIFLLLTDEPQQLKDTILSRGLRVRFRPAPLKKKTENETKVEAWLEDFTKPVPAAESAVFRAYHLVGQVLGMLKEVKDTKVAEAEQLLEDPALDNLESGQRKLLEEQLEAQAQADYLRERNQLLRAMVEWFHAKKSDVHAVETLEKLARRLSRNVNESLAWETAMLQLAR